MNSWYVLHTKPKQEAVVNRQLEDRGLDVFFPTLQFDRGYSRGIRIEPFFPHYLFVNVDLEASEATGLRWMPGVRTIVHFDSQPAAVPESIVEDLRNRLEPFEDRGLRKGEWFFKPGQQLRVTDGPFKGMDAIFQKDVGAQGRVQVLMSVLGQLTRTELLADQLETVH